ncbi:Transporter major facilitator family protein [Entamoeba marina]
MGEYLRMITLLFLLNTSAFGIELIYSIPLTTTLYLLPFWAETLINAILGPLIGIMVQPLIGALSDIIQTKWGRRRPYLIIGNIFVFVGVCIMVIVGGFQLNNYSEIEEENDSEPHQLKISVALVINLIGQTILYIGTNILQVVSRTLVLDIIPVEHQHPCALMFIAHSALARIVYIGIMTVVSGIFEKRKKF